MILHITSRQDWENAIKNKAYTAPSIETEGFIHCSIIKQAVETANIFFKGQKGLILLCIDEDKLESVCKYEAPTGGGLHNPDNGNLFPHIYGPINLSAVVKVLDFPVNGDGTFTLPNELKN
jgi:uncharacterized protein (DUF952 family)